MKRLVVQRLILCSEGGEEGGQTYQLVPTSPPGVRRLAVLQEVQESLTSPSSTDSSGDSGVSCGQEKTRQVR